MTTLEQIRKAFQMRYLAKLDNRYLFISADTTDHTIAYHLLGNNGSLLTLDGNNATEELEEMQITGFAYGGDLSGSGEIPEGQKFRDKLCGDLMTFNSQKTNGVVELANDCGAFYRYDKSEIEPVFNLTTK